MYYPSYFNQQNYNPPQVASPGLTWVQGEAGAKSYLVGAGQSVLLMDSESSSFYIKSTDSSGMPLPLRVFDYKERTQKTETFDPNNFVTRAEFETLVNSLKGAKNDGD